MTGNPNILVVEDERSEREALARVLRMEDYEVLTAEDAEHALRLVDDRVDLVLSDLRMGKNTGIDLLRMWKQRQPFTPFVLITAHGDIESAVEAMKLGAADYVTKPVNPEELLLLIRRCLDVRRKDETIEHLSRRLDDKLGLENIVGRSKPMLDVFSRVRRAAQAESTILILGESGTGKEL
ncbi:MAG: sigma-54-dependent transcriptional regulator, partial [Phycisphaerae bacterium]